DEYAAGALTRDDGAAAVSLVDWRLVGGADGPPKPAGPYRIEVKLATGEAVTLDVDRKDRAAKTVTITDPKRKVYVWAGENARFVTGEVATLDAKAVVAGDANAKPDITWKQIKGPEFLIIVDPKAAKTQVALPRQGEWTF